MLIVSCIIFFIACINTNKSFEEEIINKYAKNDKTIDLKEIFVFKWNKLYVLTPYHYPEATDSQTISNIIGTKYNKNRDQFERLMIFMLDDKIVKSISTKYEKENFIDYKPLKVDFYFNKNDPDFITSDKCTFIIKKEDNDYALLWMR